MSGVDTITVSIPTFKTPPQMLRQAIESVLNQSYGNFHLYVVNDGDESELWMDAVWDLDDSRMSLVHSHVNQGRYAVDHKIVSAASTRWWAPLDSDDWAEPTWLEVLRDNIGDADVAFSPHVVHSRSGSRTTVDRVKPWDGTTDLHWHAHLSNLWSVDFIRRWGLTNPRMRIGWDTVMTSAPWLLGNVKVVDIPLVHRQIRRGSLTSAPETRFGSRGRTKVRGVCERAWADIVTDPGNTKEIISNVR